MRTLNKKLRLAMEAGVNLMLWGKHGVGKNAMVYQFGREIGWRVITLILAQVEATDLIGMPKAVPILERAARDGFKEVLLAVNGSLTADSIPALLAAYADNWVTAYAMPSWMADCLDEPVIIFLDEANRGRRFEINAVHQLALEKRIFTHQFHHNTMIIAACNPATDDEFGLTQFGAAFFSRFAHVPVFSSKEVWTEWARGSGVHRAVIAHVERGGISTLNPSPQDWFNKLILTSVERNERAWEFVSKTIWATEKLGSDLYADACWSIIEGLIGTAEKTTFQGFYERDYKPISPEAIFVRMPDTPDHDISRVDPSVIKLIDEWSDYGDAKMPALMDSFEKAAAFMDEIYKKSGGIVVYHKDTPACNFCGRIIPAAREGAPCSDPNCATHGGRVKLMSKKAWDDFGNFWQALMRCPGSIHQVIMAKMPAYWNDLLGLFPTRLYWGRLVSAVRDVKGRKKSANAADAPDKVDVDGLMNGTAGRL